MKEILAFNKETDRKWRWVADINDVKFELYIEKWRTPKPVPEKVIIKIGMPEEPFENKKKYTKEDIEKKPEFKQEPVFEIVKKTDKCTETMRYTPITKRNDWEIGEPYIPFELVPEEPDRLAIQVIWS